ncbi:AmiR/NasT family two-component response regulator [Arthrobacter sp. 2762]
MAQNNAVPVPSAEQLQTALESRAVVNAAVSVIMMHDRSSRESAIRLLQLASRNSDKCFHEVARDILEHARGGNNLGGRVP